MSVGDVCGNHGESALRNVHERAGPKRARGRECSSSLRPSAVEFGRADSRGSGALANADAPGRDPGARRPLKSARTDSRSSPSSRLAGFKRTPLERCREHARTPTRHSPPDRLVGHSSGHERLANRVTDQYAARRRTGFQPVPTSHGHRQPFAIGGRSGALI